MDENTNNNFIERLPAEVLRKIFDFLDISDLEMCKKVSENWHGLAAETSEAKWKILCEITFNKAYKDSFRKSGLSYEELFRSLNSWSHISSAEIKVSGPADLNELSRPLLRKPPYVKRMNFLKNGVVSYPRYKIVGGEVYYPIKFDNTVVYYCTKTLNEIDRITYDFNFSYYEENDDFCVFCTQDHKLKILTKIDKQIHDMGKMSKHENYSRYYVVGNKVFYVTTDGQLCSVACTVGEDRAKLTTEVIMDAKKISNRITAISLKDDKIKMATYLGSIYEIVNGNIKFVCQLPCKNNGTSEVVSLLEEHGFDWSNQDVYDEYMHMIQIAKVKRAKVLSYNNVVFIGTAQHCLNIYYNPYRNGKLLSLWHRKPSIRIDLRKYFKIDAKKEKLGFGERTVNQIGVVEIQDGHRIVLMYCQKLVTVNVTYPSLKRNLESDVISEKKNKGLTKD